MSGAQAEPYYGMDSYKKKSNAKDVSVKNVKCNNINVNVNGLELNTTSVPFLSTLLGSEAHADEGERGASSYGSGGSYGDGRSGSGGDFKFVCINNNNNTVVVGEEPQLPPVNECAEDVEACFAEFLSPEVFLALETALESQAGITIEINGQNVVLRSFEDICLALEGLTYEQLAMEIVEIIRAVAEIRISPDLVDCIAEALDIPIPTSIPG
jgi:hypothetical protein